MKRCFLFYGKHFLLLQPLVFVDLVIYTKFAVDSFQQEGGDFLGYVT